MSTEEVLTIFLHGLGQQKITMAPIATRLKRSGLEVYNYGYHSRQFDLQTHVEMLANFLERHKEKQLNFVAHSLGGIIVRALILKYPNRFSYGRLVMLGPPNQSSSFARGLQKFLPTKLIWGPVMDDLAKLSLGPPAGVEVGIIAGSCRLKPWLFVSGHHDGLVCVAETKLDGAKEWIVIPALHATLPFKKNVARLTANFLRDGSFGECHEKITV